MTDVIKRDGTIERFNPDKIDNALKRGLAKIGVVDSDIPADIASKAAVIIKDMGLELIGVDKIHKVVEDLIMDGGHHDLAREYITYRFSHKKNIFRKRTNLKPYEYPEVLEFTDAIRHSYWIHTEFNYSSDIQDYKVNMTPAEANIIKNAMLAIAQIEVSVKTFWSKIYERFPKPEFQGVGVTFAESEVRHADAYSNLIELLGLNDEFKKLLDIPAIKKRINYLERVNKTPIENQDYFNNIILFSMFVENVSLFSQFLIMMSFNKHKNMLKGISNAVEATSKEEDIHARFGFEIVNIIKDENPTWWTQDIQDDILKACLDAYEAESDIIDWIYGDADLEFLPKYVVKEFVKDRFNQSLKAIGLDPVFDIDKEALKTTSWFVEETLSTKNIDFFVKRSTAYAKKTKSFTEDDLF
jgi:ribonucleoside-diphosphate reductase beta chain